MFKKVINTILILSIIFSGYLSVLPTQADVVIEKNIETLNQNQSLVLVKPVNIKNSEVVVEQKIQNGCNNVFANSVTKNPDNFWQNSSQSWLLEVSSSCVELVVKEKQFALAKIDVVNNSSENSLNKVVVVKTKTTFEKKSNLEERGQQNPLFVLTNKIEEISKLDFVFFGLSAVNNPGLLVKNTLLFEVVLNNAQMEVLRC